MLLVVWKNSSDGVAEVNSYLGHTGALNHQVVNLASVFKQLYNNSHKIHLGSTAYASYQVHKSFEELNIT